MYEGSFLRPLLLALGDRLYEDLNRESWGGKSKYEALLDESPSIVMQGVIERYGVDRFEILQNKVRDIANTVSDMSCLEKITVFLDQLSACMEFQQSKMPPVELPPEFFVDFIRCSWQYYVEVITG